MQPSHIKGITRAPLPTDMPCENCGHSSDAHWAVNFADGPFVSGSVLVCPTAVFRVPHGVIHVDRAKEKEKEKEKP